MHNEDGFFVVTALGYMQYLLVWQSKRGAKTLVESKKRGGKTIAKSENSIYLLTRHVIFVYHLHCLVH